MNSRYSLIAVRWAIATALLVSFGCGSGEYQLVPVSGTVTLDGDPVVGARVIFEPQRTDKQALSAGPSSDGKTDDQGRYSLQTTAAGKRGAIAGPHSVVITTFQAELDRTRETSNVIRKEEIPQRYRDVGGLTYVVPPEGSDAADFQLQSRP